MEQSTFQISLKRNTNLAMLISSVESYMRKVIKPLEALLVSHKRIVLKDSAVSPTLVFKYAYDVPESRIETLAE